MCGNMAGCIGYMPGIIEIMLGCLVGSGIGTWLMGGMLGCAEELAADTRMRMGSTSTGLGVGVGMCCVMAVEGFCARCAA